MPRLYSKRTYAITMSPIGSHLHGHEYRTWARKLTHLDKSHTLGSNQMHSQLLAAYSLYVVVVGSTKYLVHQQGNIPTCRSMLIMANEQTQQNDRYRLETSLQCPTKAKGHTQQGKAQAIQPPAYLQGSPIIQIFNCI